MSVLATIDWVFIALYFAIILGIVWWVIRQKSATSDDYFLAGRNLGWFVVGASIFASNIGSEHVVGLAGSGATDGVAMAHYELHAWCLLVLGWVLAPFYMRSRIYTMPEFLERRFSASSRWVLSVISLIAYILTKVAVGIFAGGIVFGVLLPEVNFMGLNSFWVGSILMILLTGLYTLLGGMKAVAYTEALQTIVLILGSVLVTYYGLEALGGWGELRRIAGSEMFNLWKPLVPEGMTGTWSPVKTDTTMAWYFNTNYPWLGMLFCAPIIGLWYWCTDQYIVQRILGAANLTEARRGTIAASFFKLLPVFIFIIPGIITFALASSGKMPELAATLLDENGQIINANAQQVFPLLVSKVLPAGIRGIVVAGLLAALMSSLAGVFNASSTLFTMDLYSKFRPQATEKQLVLTGRIATAVMVIIGLLWIPVIQGSRGLYDYLQSVQGYLAPPIFVVFFFGIFNKRLNAKGALAALLVGFGLGLFRLAIDTPVMLTQGFSYEEHSLFWIINNIFFQYYSLIIFLVSAVVFYAVSYTSEAPNPAQIQGLAMGTVSAEQQAATKATYRTIDYVMSGLVLVLILAAYLYFNG
ncbi:MAG TPA: sodium:solute symporter [Saprospiraceae bacterium]|nr:sodium:solute symporter [Saprospiraceae bacterium]HMQ82758.1 sodium:solute symporter [Saprospiraceae bacterium]